MFDKKKAKMGHLDEIMNEMDHGESQKLRPKRQENPYKQPGQLHPAASLEKPKGSLVNLTISAGEKKTDHGDLPDAPELPSEKEELDDESLKKLMQKYMSTSAY